MSMIKVYESETGDKKPDNQVFYHEWYQRYIKWLEMKHEELQAKANKAASFDNYKGICATKAYVAMEILKIKKLKPINMNTFFDRLLQEKNELGDRLEKLKAFLDKGAPSASEKQANWMARQRDAMQSYYDMLVVRVKDLELEGLTASQVHKAKSSYASVIDQMNDLRSSSTDPEQKRLASVAITEAQGAQMWAVKAITWKS